MTADSNQGLLYVIATSGSREALEEARGARSRLEAMLPSGVSLESRELRETLWGYVSTRQGAPDRITRAESGSLEVVVRGDPIWTGAAVPGPCDASTLRARWESDGARAGQELDNLFVALVADREKQELTVVTDRTGGIHLYSACLGSCRVLCSSYLLLSRLVDSPEIDRDAIAVFFHLGYFPARRTALRAVEVHPFGSTTVISRGELQLTECWQPRMAINESRRPQEFVDDTVDAFNVAVRECVGNKEISYLAMTAGLDSRCIASSLLHQKLPFKTYTHGFPGCWEERCVERIVKRHSLPHRFVPLTGEFSDRLQEYALDTFRASEGEISCVEKSHLVHVLSTLRQETEGADPALLLGGGAGTMKGTFYRLLREEAPYTGAGIDRYIEWNFRKKHPDLFAPDLPLHEPRVLREFVQSTLEEVEGGTFYQKLDYLFLVRYRRWASAVKGIYRRFHAVREPFMSARLLDILFSVPPAIKKSKLPHFEVLRRNYPAFSADLTNTMSPALPLGLRTWPRFLPSAIWRTKQVLRGLSRRYLPRELFPLVDYVDYRKWIRSASALSFVEELLDPGRMKSSFLYKEEKLKKWLSQQRQGGFGSYRLVDRICTLELYFREIGK